LSAAAVWPVKANGKIFVVTPERRSHAIDAKTGKELWSARGGREAIGLSQDGSAVYIKTMQDTVIAFSTKDYNIAANANAANTPIKLWESHTGYGYEIAPSPMTTANGLIFVPTDKGNIFALNATDGTVAWQYRFSIALINYIRPITYQLPDRHTKTNKDSHLQKSTAQPGNRLLLVTSMDGKVAILSY